MTTYQRLVQTLLPAALLLGLSSCASMLYRQRGFSPVKVEVTGPLLAETTSNYDLWSGAGLSVQLFGGDTGVTLREEPDQGEATLTLAAAPRFLGHWLVGPLFPIPFIPLFGLPREPPKSQVVLMVWGHPTREVGILKDETWIQFEGADLRTPLSRVVATVDRGEALAPEGTSTVWIPHPTGNTLNSSSPDAAALVFDVSPHGVEGMSANVGIVLGSGERGSLRVELRQKSALAYDPIGMSIGWRGPFE